MVNALFPGSPVQDGSHVKFLLLGQKVSKSLPRKKPTQSIPKGEPSFPMMGVYALQLSWPQGKPRPTMEIGQGIQE